MSNVKSQMSKVVQKGFTLVELLAVILVFSIIGGIGTIILVTSLRTTSKTNTLTNVKQNGNYAISQMVKIIRDASLLTGPSCTVAVYPTPIPTISSISLLTSTNQAITFACDNTNKTILYNGESFLDTAVVKTASCSFTCSQTTITDYPVVGISFTLESAQSSPIEQKANAVPFSTTVILRNQNR